MQRGMIGLGPDDFVFRANHFIFTVKNLGLGSLELSVQFRNLKHRQGLACAHAVSDVDINMPHVSGNLCVYFDFLIRLKLTSQRERIRKHAALHDGYGGCGNFRGFGIGVAISHSILDSNHQRDQRQNSNRNQDVTLTS